MIEVKNLHKSFGDAHVLKGISTTFYKGKTNLIIGQSGSGKTVFIKCLLGLFDYEEGSIAYDGQVFAKLTEDDKRNMRAEIGMVFQGSALFDSMTIAENVMFPLRMFTKMSKGEMEDRADFVLKRVNLDDAHKKMPSEASGGMQKRVAIARAIGEKIVFLKDGLKAWEGSNDTIFKTDNEVVTDFVYSSELMKKVRQMYIEEKQ